MVDRCFQDKPFVFEHNANNCKISAVFFCISLTSLNGTMICTATAQEWLDTDLADDGQLKIIVQTFNHGLDVFTVPDSGCNCLLWTTARSGPRGVGQPNGMNRGPFLIENHR